MCTLLSVLYIPGSPPEQNIEIVIGDTDYNSYAIMYYQKQGKITMKLYGRFLPYFFRYFILSSTALLILYYFGKYVKGFLCCAVFAGKSVDNLSEPLLTKFEELAAKQNLQQAYHFPFPTYSMANFTVIIQNTNSNLFHVSWHFETHDDCIARQALDL